MLDETKRHDGIVNWFDNTKGFGYITPVNEDKERIADDVFVHHSSIICEGYQTLSEGEPVKFGVVHVSKGTLATEVVSQQEKSLEQSQAAPEKNAEFPPLDTGERHLGIVEWFNAEKGFGYIIPVNEKGEQNGEKIYAHYRDIQGEGYKSLDDNEVVEFGISDDSPQGRMAKDIKSGMNLPQFITKPQPAEEFPPLDTGERYQGTVKWFNPERGFGFITPVNEQGEQIGEHIYVRYEDIKGTGYKSLDEGEAVEFKVEEGEHGPIAKDVSPIERSKTAGPKSFGERFSPDSRAQVLER